MDLPNYDGLYLEIINFCGEYEIAFREPVDFVRPDGDFDTTPPKAYIGMMSLCFGEFSYAVDQSQRLAKIRHPVFFTKMMVGDDLPALKLRKELLDFSAGQRRYTAPTWHALAAR